MFVVMQTTFLVSLLNYSGELSTGKIICQTAIFITACLLSLNTNALSIISICNIDGFDILEDDYNVVDNNKVNDLISNYKLTKINFTGYDSPIIYDSIDDNDLTKEIMNSIDESEFKAEDDNINISTKKQENEEKKDDIN
jgi:hypothetical protein